VNERRDHARFLSYRETYAYFRRPGLPLLAWDEWRALDGENTALTALGDARDAEQRARLKAVRALLLRD
jgi:hypothetical protein